MPDPIEGQNPNPAPAQPAPAAAFDPEAFKAELTASLKAEFDARVAGVQGVFQKQVNERDEQIKQLQTASLSEDEREQLRQKEANEYLESLERQVWLSNEASKKYPTAAAHLQKLFETGGDVEAFAAYLEESLKPKEPAAEPDPAATVSDVDPNNAPRVPVTSANDFVGPDGQVYTPELRKQILESFGNTPTAQAFGGR